MRFLIMAVLVGAPTQDKPEPTAPELWRRAEQARGEGRSKQALEWADRAVVAEPKRASSHVRRGMLRFQLGKVKESIQDFDRAVELDADVDPYLWQRGISHYYVGRFKDGREQFERHRAVNGDDVENSAWHFLCAARELSVEAARGRFLPIAARPDGSFPDRRVPMAEVYALFAGTGKVDAIWAAARDDRARFYAHLYVGLYHEAHGRMKEAVPHLEKAASDKLRAAGGYMGDVAHVHVSRLDPSLRVRKPEPQRRDG